MHRVILCTLFVCVVGNTKEIYEKCKLVIENQPYENCCNDFVTNISVERFRDLMDKTGECLNIPDSETNCDREMCYAKQMGFITDSGEIDITLVERIVVDLNLYVEDSEILEVLRQKCFYVPDHEAYGAEGACELKKLHNCINSQISLQCRHWKTSDACIEFQKVAEECAGFY